MAGMAETVRFPIPFSPGNSVLFRALLILPSASYVELDQTIIYVRLG